MRLAVFAGSAVALTLAGCASSAPATTDGACRAVSFPAPYAVRADTRAGQRWIDTTIEAGVRVCGHARPPEALPAPTS